MAKNLERVEALKKAGVGLGDEVTRLLSEREAMADDLARAECEVTSIEVDMEDLDEMLAEELDRLEAGVEDEAAYYRHAAKMGQTAFVRELP